MPSSPRQISATAAAFLASSAKRRSTARTRAVKSSTAPNPPMFSLCRRQLERVQAIHLFPQAAQAFLAGREDRHGRRLPEHGVGQFRHGRQQMLAIVEQQQEPAIAQRADDGLHRQAARARRHGQHGGGRGDHHRRVGQRRQIDQPDAVGVAGAQRLGKRNGKPGLADPARPGDRQQAMALAQRAQLGEFLRATDERGRRLGQVGFRRGQDLFGRRFHRRRRLIGRRRVARGFAPTDRPGELIAPPRDRRDPARAEHLAQARDMNGEIVLFDEGIRPDQIDQLVLRHDPLPPFHECREDADSAGRQVHRPVGPNQRPLRDEKPEITETICALFHHPFSLRGRYGRPDAKIAGKTAMEVPSRTSLSGFGAPRDSFRNFSIV